MSENLCTHLCFVRDDELRRGNEIESVVEGAFAKCELLVTLKRPFGAYYEDAIEKDIVTTDINNDPHCPVGKSYYCQRDRHAIFAPQVTRR